MKIALRFVLVCLLFASPLPRVRAEEPLANAAGLKHFEAKIRPVLVRHCYECHSTQSGSDEGGLRVDSREAIRRGGSRGPAVVPGQPEASWLLKAISHTDPDLKMPPRQRPLPESVVADFRKWIEMGAPDPRDEKSASNAAEIAKAARNHWAFQPVKTVTPPAVKDAAWPQGSIDHFILAALEQRGLAPSPNAEPSVLLRRVHFDLVGLPPAPEVIEQFERRIETAGLDTALAEQVDYLLASPQFGERWGRHWLDVARFGESSGKEANITFPYAWRYRDYVLDCFNEDLPYNRFLEEQIAGDLLPYEGNRERARLLIATGFLAIGAKNLDEANELQFIADVIDEQIDSLTRAVTATSVACARCHDHKFDPFSMRDYYALAGIFASTKTYFGTAVSPANRVGGDPLVLPEIEGQVVLHASIPAERVRKLKEELAALKKEEQDGHEAVRKAIAEGRDPSGIFTLTDALRIFWRSGAIEGELERVSDTGQALPLAMGTLDHSEVIDAPLLERGDVARPGERVPRGFPAALHLPEMPAIPKDQSGRRELAQWLTDPAHPLTARVYVNRLWQHLFGAGIVATVDDFGSTGSPPSHPELLDYLARRFIEQGWSTKKLIREIVLSRAYRQNSTYRETAFQIDPDNRLLWRMSKRRLEAEAIRDAMLAASGELNLARPAGSLVGKAIGDRPVSLIGLDRKLPKDLDGSVHRSVYLPIIRDRLPDVLELFDFAEASLVTGQRQTTNVPLQAHYLMNGPFVAERSRALAARLMREAGSDEERIRRAFLLCFSRPPLPDEQTRVMEFLHSDTTTAGAASAGDASDPPPALISLSQALLSTAEFRNLD